MLLRTGGGAVCAQMMGQLLNWLLHQNPEAVSSVPFYLLDAQGARKTYSE